MKKETAAQRREREQREQQVLIEEARCRWIGQRVRFVHLLDQKVKIGHVVRISDNGDAFIEYQLIPGENDCLCELYTSFEELGSWFKLVEG